MWAIQGSFGCLQVPLDIKDNQGHARLLKVCVCLNNLRANHVGISQIHSVYQPVLMDEDKEMWHNVKNMVFYDIRRQDQVVGTIM